ncbi:MAG TPA: isoleucine--tRNA ligase [Bdellovibrionota bacterium]|nr:isoleucine--tRNA ligase [Bdellovibrionota bacterium]
MDYKSTIQLPKTDFPMKANLTQREPIFLERWEKAGLYRQILAKNSAKPLFLLHDGPPYANGNIHVGHVMNKTLKDLVVKSKSMAGFLSPYVPGWDCHGLPIEHQVVKQLGGKAKSFSKLELRRECRKYAERFIDIQREEFKRLGIFGEWENPYRTMDFSYEAQIAREFAKVVDKGFVYRSRRSIHWCISCQTALAEAEIEYEDHQSPSVYVAYPIASGWEKLGLPKSDPKERFALIWTTTPWTLPASMAIAYQKTADYVVVERKGKPGRFIMAKAMVEQVAEAQQISLKEVGNIGKGERLASLVAQHPFVKREIHFFPGEHVTLDTGSGLVHTAPGHGEEDYQLGLEHGLEIYSPVGPDGRFEKDVEHFAGERVFEANPKIIEHLKKLDRLFEKELKVTHSYPHCWRCKNPVVFRATAQWFLSLSHRDLRKNALEEIDRILWIPKWGRERIYGMVAGRPDWCLSRQRVWGVPVITFVCKACGENLLSASAVSHVAERFAKEGSDAWFQYESAELLPTGTACTKCGAKDFEKGQDILDVWFDSGASHAAVLEQRTGLRWPCDLYLEGSDQHRGWFHSSLLEGMATRGHAPFKAVVTHGFVVDGEGRKMSKSVGNYISAQESVKERGAEMLRLWVAMEDYRDDVRLSKEILDRAVESYRRIRNTARFCLGNLFDFEPDRHRVPRSELSREIDRWAADRLAQVAQKCRKAYEDYEFHVVVQSLNEFCVVELSAWYLDISKDTLYCDRADGARRRSAQTVLFDVADHLTRLLAPILPMTAEEIWDHLPAFNGKTSSVHLAEFPPAAPAEEREFAGRWEKLFLVRGEVSKALEKLRQQKVIGQSLEAEVEVAAPEPIRTLIEQYQKELPMLWIVSRARLTKSIAKEMDLFESAEIPGLKVGVRKIVGQRCERCWTYPSDVGAVEKHLKLCRRCAEVIDAI